MGFGGGAGAYNHKLTGRLELHPLFGEKHGLLGGAKVFIDSVVAGFESVERPSNRLTVLLVNMASTSCLPGSGPLGSKPLEYGRGAELAAPPR